MYVCNISKSVVMFSVFDETGIEIDGIIKVFSTKLSLKFSINYDENCKHCLFLGTCPVYSIRYSYVYGIDFFGVLLTRKMFNSTSEISLLLLFA